MNTLTPYQIERRAERDAMEGIASEVCKHLIGWRLQPSSTDPDDMSAWTVIESTTGPQSFTIGKEWNAKDRLSMSAHTWPEYSYFERGEQRSTQVTPRDCYDPKEASPGITVAADRAPDVIAREILRRFIPDYTRIYARCAEKAAASQAYHDKARKVWETVCATVAQANGTPVNLTRTSHNVKSTAGEYNFSVENRGGEKVHCAIDATPEVFAMIVEALKVRS